MMGIDGLEAGPNKERETEILKILTEKAAPIILFDSLGCDEETWQRTWMFKTQAMDRMKTIAAYLAKE